MVSAPGEDEGRLKWGRVKRIGGNFHDDFFSLENVAAKNITLRDHLIGQVNIDFHDPIEAIIAYKLIDMLDDNGWLSCSLQTVANELSCTVERVKKTLSRCQELDPPGVFGRTLAECLMLQLREKEPAGSRNGNSAPKPRTVRTAGLQPVAQDLRCGQRRSSSNVY